MYLTINKTRVKREEIRNHHVFPMVVQEAVQTYYCSSNTSQTKRTRNIILLIWGGWWRWFLALLSVVQTVVDNNNWRNHRSVVWTDRSKIGRYRIKDNNFKVLGCFRFFAFQRKRQWQRSPLCAQGQRARKDKWRQRDRGPWFTKNTERFLFWQ